MKMMKIYEIVNCIFFATTVPGLLIVSWLIGLITLGALKACLIISFIVFVVLPLIFKYSITLQRGILFLTFIAPPSTSTLKKPHTAGLYATRQFYISSKHQDDEYEIQLGVWHILPNYIAKKFSTELNLNERNLISLIEARSHDKQEFAIERIQDELKQKFPVINEKNEQEFYETTLKQDETRVLVYFHGNTGSRAAGHRVELYKLLRDLGFHVITFDYRSYGDSTSATMTEAGVVRDALNVYKYAAAITKGPIFVWGHSLGTGVLTHLMTIINKSNETLPKMVVLESPFNNIWDEVREHPLSRLFRHLPWFDVTVSHPMFQNNLRFQSDKNIAQIHQPIAIIHAQDDLVVPFKLGYKLYLAALDQRKKGWGPTEFYRFSFIHGYGHKQIFRAPELPDIIMHLVNTYQNRTY